MLKLSLILSQGVEDLHIQVEFGTKEDLTVKGDLLVCVDEVQIIYFIYFSMFL
jgi:hypothetical protein